MRVVSSKGGGFRRRLWSEAGADSRAEVTKEGVEGEARLRSLRARKLPCAIVVFTADDAVHTAVECMAVKRNEVGNRRETRIAEGVLETSRGECA